MPMYGTVENQSVYAVAVTNSAERYYLNKAFALFMRKKDSNRQHND